MHEYGAEEAFCVRKMHTALKFTGNEPACYIGVVKRDFPQHWTHPMSEGQRVVYYGDKIGTYGDQDMYAVDSRA